ncbi:MAG: cyclic nucleotide-binding domain-containing protein [Alphaproteobacteria bacterium]|nr:cyclic nucleotide-binding domain-containing protein [Alphaproteobacteria bacterium]MDP6815706.1 cyclic nucleotide-binding domain-containing protein [Alphaproteobacteria bacterium]
MDKAIDSTTEAPEAVAKAEPAERRAQFQVHVAGNDLERRRLYEFRYKVLVQELGLGGPNVDSERRMVRDQRDQRAQHLFVTADGEIAGCLRLVTAERTPPTEDMRIAYDLDAFQDLPPKRLTFSDRLAVAEAWRSSRVPALLTAAAFKLARSSGARFDFTHCPPALIGLYEKMGYRAYSGNFLQSEVGLQVPMILVMDDIAHLTSLNSPFAQLALQYKLDQATTAWFHKTFPEVAHRPIKALRDEKRFWEYLTKRLHQNPLHGIPLFDGLTYTEASRFLKDATTLALREGDMLVREGELGEEMFVLLSGTVEVRDGADRTLTSFGKGQAVGEIAYLAATPRSADIVVTEDTEVLVLTQALFERLLAREPAIAAKILFSLSLILCERLRATTQRLTAQG